MRRRKENQLCELTTWEHVLGKKASEAGTTFSSWLSKEEVYMCLCVWLSIKVNEVEPLAKGFPLWKIPISFRKELRMMAKLHIKEDSSFFPFHTQTCRWNIIFGLVDNNRKLVSYSPPLDLFSRALNFHPSFPFSHLWVKLYSTCFLNVISGLLSLRSFCLSTL